MSVATASTARDPDDFDHLASVSRGYFDSMLAQFGPHLFEVQTDDLYAIYLDRLPQNQRAYHTCNCCKDFIRRFGNLALIDNKGALVPAMWASGVGLPHQGFYQDAVDAMARAVSSGTVTGVFLSREAVWGKPVAGNFTHFSINQPASRRYGNLVLTAEQAMAARREDFRTLSHGLAEYKPDMVKQALGILEADALYRAEKVIGPAKFLSALHDARQNAASKLRKDNLVWKAVAGAPAGFCTPRSSMIGTLLDDLATGMGFDDIKRRFASKMAPHQYLRPQVAATAGNIKQAEELVQKMGIEPALHRRFARLDEIQTIWMPTNAVDRPMKPGVFGHLTPKGEQEHAAAPLKLPLATITWDKFRRTVLSDARQIEVYLPSGRLSLGAFVTATNPDAPPILQWDTLERRNPFSNYVYISGSTPEEWSLRSGTWVKATAISLVPNSWNEDVAKYTNHSSGAMFVLEGAKDRQRAGLALFPEILKSELHPVRKTIEAFSQKGELSGKEEASANGLIIRGKVGAKIRVTNSVGIAQYQIDRWD